MQTKKRIHLLFISDVMVVYKQQGHSVTKNIVLYAQAPLTIHYKFLCSHAIQKNMYRLTLQS